MTQEQLAVDARVDRTVVSGLERSAYNVSIDLLQRIANALDVDIVNLFRTPADDVPIVPLPAGRKSKPAHR